MDCVSDPKRMSYLKPISQFGRVVRIRLGNLLIALSIACKVRIHMKIFFVSFKSKKNADDFLSSTNAFAGTGGKNFANGHPRVWQCSNQQPADGKLICCDIKGNDQTQKNNCCPGFNPINLFFIGSERSGASITSITLSASSSSLPTNSPASSSSATSTPSTQNTSGKSNSTTIAIAVSVSIGAILLIVAAFYFYRRGRKSRMERIPSRMESIPSRKELIHSPTQGTFELRVSSTQELSAERIPHEILGFERFEMSTKRRPELPE